MKIGKINIKVGKMKLKAVKVFIEGRITIIDDNKNKFNSYGNEKVYLYVENGYISWKENKNNKIQGIEEIMEEIKTNGRAN
jgi:PKD repeat protein